ncbi:galactokinase [bacterium]|nr:MAG: galactokinase [bacterium]
MIIAQSPLRISFGGGGTDLPSYYREFGGFLIAAAISKHVYVSIQRAFNPGCLLRYSQIEHVHRIEEIRHPIIREALKLLNVDINYLEITSFADLPAGTGLGSSGSFGTALLKGLHRHARKVITTEDLAKMACHIELDILKEPIGKQDQYAAAFGGLNCYTFNKDDSVTVIPLDISSETLRHLNERLILFSTGISRGASDILKTQDRQTKEHQKEMVDNLHFVKQIGFDSRKALESGDLDAFGRLLDLHWRYKKQRSNIISSEKINHWYSLAMKNGALGGKLIGAGGGGFLMFYTQDPTHLRNIMMAEGDENLAYGFTYEGTKLLDGAEM